MKSIITCPSRLNSSDTFPESVLEPTDVRTLRVPTRLVPQGDSFTLGTRFHSLLRRIGDHGPLDANEMELLPWLQELRDELRTLGVRYIEPEVDLHSARGFGNGRCDLLLSGGLTSFGIAEVKVTKNLPETPASGPCMQLGGYGALAASRANYGQWRQWGCLAFVCFPERAVRLFVYRSLQPMRRAAVGLLAA